LCHYLPLRTDFKVTLVQLLAIHSSSSTKKKLVSRITRFFPTAVTKVAQEGLPGLEIVRADKNANHNSTHIGSMISVMENADAPVPMQGRHEAH
jgi:hypothetical protein